MIRAEGKIEYKCIKKCDIKSLKYSCPRIYSVNIQEPANVASKRLLGLLVATSPG